MRISAWFHPFAVALLVTPAFASPARTQTIASADAVLEGLSAPEWSSIRQPYEQQRHAAFSFRRLGGCDRLGLPL